MKFELDMTLVTENNEVLGILEGVMNFNAIPTVGEESILFDNNDNQKSFHLFNYFQQKQELESLVLFDEQKKNSAIGKCFFSFFYIPSIEMKDEFLTYLKENYDIDFWEF